MSKFVEVIFRLDVDDLDEEDVDLDHPSGLTAEAYERIRAECGHPLDFEIELVDGDD